MLITQHQIKTLMSFKFLFIYSPMGCVRTPRALDQHCYYPNQLHVYTQAQFLSQAPGTVPTHVGEARGREDLTHIRVSRRRAGSLLGLILY